MASSHVQTALLALLLCLCSNAMVTMAAKDLDFFYLVLMWPGSHCQLPGGTCCLPTTGKPGVDFFVDGLLPYSKDGTPLTHCKMSPFHINQLDEVADELHNYWPSITCPSNDGRSLWLSAWKTYGVCSGLSAHEYFKKALDLRSKVDLLTTFKKHGIVPSGVNYYTISGVLAAVEEATGEKGAVYCAKNAWDESMVYKIYMCVDKDASTFIQCPVLPEKTCVDPVVFGLFTYDMLSNKTGVAANPIRMRVQPL